MNPAAAVRGPKHVVTKGATPVLSPAEARKLLEIDTGALAGLRDRALLSVMLYSFARVSAVLGMRRQDYFGQGSRGWLRLHEKGGRRHDVPAHHRAVAALDAYVEAAGIEEPKAALFQTVDPAGRRLTGRALDRRLVLAMIKRRAAAAGLPPSTCGLDCCQPVPEAQLRRGPVRLGELPYREHRAAGRHGVPPDAPLDFAPAVLQPLRRDGVTGRRRWEAALRAV